MPSVITLNAEHEPKLNLRNPALAAFLAWLIPGAGHLYQGRTGKGILFLVCILGTFAYGMYLGNGKVVYWSLRPGDFRWAYFCQVGVGLPALPALIQAERARGDHEPPTGFMAPPLDSTQWRNEASRRQRAPDLTDAERHRLKEMYSSPDELAWWSKSLHRYFELGTVFTMIAGLLNVLAIYDAYAGPVPPEAAADDADEDDQKAA